ncbi:hypothetical protein KKP90_03990 [Methanothermococcus sp. SCGC AD-155-E23]|nr:hypothetical protein [Methanothermococcus sp. SCGC AD-155-E23]
MRGFFFLFLFLIFSIPVYGVEFVNFDYKNEYLEPGKTYDLWVVIQAEEEMNNSVVGIYPYGVGSQYIEILKGKDYIGYLPEGVIDVGHFFIHIKEGTPSGDYKVVVYCNYTRDGKKYSNNRVFEIPVRGKPALTLEYTPLIEEGMNRIYIVIKNEGTGTAQDVKIRFEEGENIYALSEGYIPYIKPGEGKAIEVKVYGVGTGMAKLPYILQYSTPYNNLQLVEKSESESIHSKTVTYTYKNQRKVEERGNLVFKIIPSDAVEIEVKNPLLPLGEITNFTLTLKNNYRDTRFTVMVGRYYIGNNKKSLFLRKGEVRNITFTLKMEEGGIKEIPVKVIFEGKEIERNIAVDVIGKAELVLTGVNVEGTGDLIITGDLSNLGTGRARGVLISLKKTEYVIPMKPYENYFIGTLEPNDYGSFELHAKVINETDVIPVVIQYREENNRVVKVERNISVRGMDIYISGKREGEYIPLIFGGLFLLGVLFLLYRVFLGKGSK